MVYSLNTGNLPDKVEVLTKLVCGKIARKRIPSLQRLAAVSTGGATTINLRTALPDFFDFKLDPDNDNRIVYSLDTDNVPTFYKLVSPSTFAQYTQGGYAKKEGSSLIISVPENVSTPTTLYFPYFSFYCFEDSNTLLRIETPINSDDECLIPAVFDDVIIDGILLFISRREKETNEYTKNVTEWEKRINEIIFYS